MLKRKIVSHYPIECHNNLSPIKFQRKSSNISPGKSPLRSKSPFRITSPYCQINDNRSTSPIKFVKNQCIKKISKVLAIKKQQNGFQEHIANQQNYFKKMEQPTYFKAQQQQFFKIKPLTYQKFNTNTDKFISQQKGKLFSKLVEKLNSDKKQNFSKLVTKKSQNDVCQFKIQNEEKVISRKTSNINYNKTMQNVQIVQSTIYQAQKNDLQKAKQLSDKFLVQVEPRIINQNSYINKNPAQNNSNIKTQTHSVKNIKNRIVKQQQENQNYTIQENYFKNTQIKMKTVQKSEIQKGQFAEQFENINMYLMKIKESYKEPIHLRNNTQNQSIMWNNDPVNMSLNMNPFM